MNKIDWLLIHEALCFATLNEEKFEKLLQRNKPSVLEAWKKGRDKSGGHELIGKIFKMGEKK
jgi:hypothetical protein